MSAFPCNVLFLQIIFVSVCFCEITHVQENKYLSDFVEFLNKVPNKPYIYDNGVILNAQRDGENIYKIVTKIKATDIKDSNNIKYVICSSTIIYDVDQGVVVQNDYHCIDEVDDGDSQFAMNLEEAVNDPVTSTETVNQAIPSTLLDYEVQSNNVAIPGEQFIAVTRDQPAPCIGCMTHVDPNAVGITELAELGIRHLNWHEPNFKHTIYTVNDVKRQVQVVGGVRYILIMTIDYNDCATTKNKKCTFKKTCKITILENPWKKLPSDSKHRAILANNCTESWLFGDDGEVIPHVELKNKENNEVIAKTTSELELEKNDHMFITEEELQKIQDQIIPLNKFKDHGENDDDISNINENENVKHLSKVDAVVPQKKSKLASAYEDEFIHNTGSINDEKKKVIDDLMNFFNFAGFDPKAEKYTDDVSRMKRSFDSDLQVMSLQEKFYKLKKHLINAKLLYTLGQVLVDYLNEMDMEVKTRVLNDILAAEEEYEGNQNFFYIKVRINIPCDKAECFTNDTETKICNGVLENSKLKNPKVLTAFCYKDDSKISKLGVVKDIPIDDPILLKIINEAVKKIENDLTNANALKPTKILSANTQRVSGTLTKVSMILVYTDCNVTVPIVLRENNCTILEHLGSKVCNVEVLERHWIKEKKLSYNCNERPIDVSFSESKGYGKKKIGSVNDPIALDIAQDALQYLETESNVNKRQTILKIQSVTTQILAGMLTEVEFIVGYTDCEYNLKYSLYAGDKSIQDCKLLQNQQLRVCRARVWERPWLQDDRQFNVTCEFDSSDYNKMSMIRKEKPLQLDIPRQRNPNDPKYYKLAEKSLKSYLLARDINQHHKILKIEQVTTQQVSGVLTKIKFVISPTNCSMDPNGMVLLSMNCVALNQIVKCTADIVERPWINSILMQANCTEISNGDTLNTVIAQDPNNIQYKKIAEESLKQYMKTSGVTKHYQVLEVLKVTTETVSGQLTKIEFNIVPTSCEIDTNGKPTSPKCYVESFKNIVHCKADVLEKQWLNKKDVDITCDSSSAETIKRNKLGDEKQEQINNIIIRAMAEESLRKYVTSSGLTQYYKVCSIGNVTTQVNSGKLTKIYFNTAPTNCEVNKNGEPAEENCKIDTSNNNCHIECYTEVWEESWLKKKDINVECIDKNKSRAKRAVKNDVVQKDERDPKYRKLAENAVKVYQKNNNLNRFFKVINVVYVTSLLKRTEIFEIYFQIAPTKCKLKGRSNLRKCKPLLSEILDCHATITTKADLNQDKVDRVDCAKPKVMQVKNIVRNLGKDIDIQDPELMELARRSLHQYLKNGENYYVTEITSVKWIDHVTVITFEALPENCHGAEKQASCEKEKLKCLSTASQNTRKLAVECFKVLYIIKLPPLHEENAANEEYKKKAQNALQEYLKSSQMKRHYEILYLLYVTSEISVLSSSNQVLQIYYKISPTSCALDNSGQTVGSNCKILNSFDSYSCISLIEVNQATKEKIKSDTDCNLKNKPQKIKILINTNKTLNDWAQKSLNEYLKQSDIHTNYVVKRVNNVASAGRVFKLQFEISPTNCLAGPKCAFSSTNCKTDDKRIITCYSELLNNKVNQVICDDNREAKINPLSIAGGIVERDPSDPIYKSLAQKALLTFSKKTGTKLFIVTQVLRATTQVISGISYGIDFMMSPTDCKIDVDDSTIANCKPDTSKSHKCQCTMVQKPWLQLTYVSSIDCTYDSANVAEISHVLDDQEHHVGGETIENANDPKYKVLAEESIQKYVKDTGSTKSYHVLKVNKVTSQVVSGSIIRIDFEASPTNCQNRHKRQRKSTCEVLNCHSEIYESWENRRDISVNCSSQNVGAETIEDPDDPKYKALAEESVQKYNEDLFKKGKTGGLELVKVKKVTSQIVSGTLTKIDFEATPSPCRDRLKRQRRANCELIDCHSEIYEVPWENKKNISVNCGVEQKSAVDALHGVSQEQNLGGETIENENDPKYKALAEESMQKYVKNTGSTKNYEVLKVNKVTSQEVSGTITRIDFDAAPTNCKNRNKKQLLHCHSEIYEVPWKNKRDISVNCNSQNVGAETIEDPDDPKFKALAEESVQKYNEDLFKKGKTGGLELVKVKKVTSQIVSGTLTKIDFEATPSPCRDRLKRQRRANCELIDCHSEIYEVPWENKKNISVNCGVEQKSAVDALHGVSQEQNLGGETIENENDPKYKALAEESMQKYVENTGSTKNYEVLKVNKVTSQEVSGTITRIDFDAAPTNCKNRNKKQLLHCHSEIYEVPWENKRDVSVNCSNQNQLGAETIEDPNDPKYKVLAEESMQKYVKDTGSTKSYQVLKVNKVTSQLVSGTIIRIDFEASPTNCQNRHKRQRKSTSEVLNCHSEIYEVSWENQRDISVNCNSQNVGAETIEDPNDPKYKALAEESVQKYNEDLFEKGKTGGLELVTVKKVTSQIVSGTLTIIDFEATPSFCRDRLKRQRRANCELIDCHSEIYEVPWENKKNISVNCGIEQKSAVEALHGVSQEQNFGREIIENENDPKYKVLAEESMQKFVKDTGSTKNYQVLKVNKVTSQVVSGTITRIYFEASPTNCQNYKRQRKSTCEVLYCHSELYEVSWENRRDISVNCSSQNVGAETIEDPDDPKYKALAEESVQKYNEDLFKKGKTGGLELVKVKKVTSQIVSGTLTKIDFEATPSPCRDRLKRQRRANCELIDCHSEIYEVPWENKKNISVNCGVEQKSTVEALHGVSQEQNLGGETIENENDPKYKALAEESMQKYVENTGSTKNYEVLKVNKVTSQEVSGTITRIDFDAAPTNCKNRNKKQLLHCHSEIYEVPWENKRDVSVNCSNQNQLGAETIEDPNDPKYKVLAEESMQKYVKDTGSTKSYQVLKVNKVTSQLVSGTIIRIDFEASPTNCQNRHKRQRKSTSEVLNCHSEIYEVSWENKRDISVNCNSQNVGAETIEDPDDPKYKALAEESVQKYNEDLFKKGKTGGLELVKVKKVTNQIVSGTLTKIDFEATPSPCRDRLKRQRRANCELIDCHSEIYEVPWENKKNISVNCGVEQKSAVDALHGVSQEQNLGGETIENENDPKYKVLAEESMQKYVENTGSTKNYEVLKVNKVTSQEVSGTITRIDFDAAPTNCKNRNKKQLLHCHSEIYEVPWENKRDVFVNCSNQNQLGAETIEDPNDPKYKVLAEESMQKYVKDTGSTKSYQVLKVNKVTSQLVSGTIIRIDFEASNCQNRNKKQLLHCHSEIYDVPWENKKNISINCDIEQKTAVGALHDVSQEQLAGGETVENANDPKYKALAEESIQKYMKDTGSTKSYKVLKVNKVTSQVVSGLITRIDFDASPTNCQNRHKRQRKSTCEVLNCHSEVKEVPWKNKRDISVSCSSQNVGAETIEDPDDPKYKALAEESVQKYNEGLFKKGKTGGLELVKVKKVTSQIVSGTLTKIDFETTPSPCRDRLKRQRRANCELIDCHSEIYEVPWENTKNISVNCDMEPKSPVEALQDVSQVSYNSTKIGAKVEQNADNPIYKVLAENLLQKYLRDTKTLQNYKLLMVNKVYTQVVNGLRTTISFDATPINCQECEIISCESSILDRQWINKTDMSVQCKKKSSQKQKELKFKAIMAGGTMKKLTLNTGGETEKDANDPKYKVLAEESLQKYIKDSGSTENYKVLIVKKVTSQIVSGTKTKIDFEASPTKCQNHHKRQRKAYCDVLDCHSDIYEVPWQNKRGISVYCRNQNQIGGKTVEDANDPKYKTLAEESLNIYLKIAQITESHKVIQVDKVFSQLVAGSLATIEFKASPTSCQNRHRRQRRTNCEVLNCRSKVWEREWLNLKDISVNCSNVVKQIGLKLNPIGELQITGGQMIQDPTNPKYKTLAEECLNKYKEDLGITGSYKVIKVTRVTTQVVSGFLTKIEFEASGDCQNHRRQSINCDVLSCRSRVWERRWLQEESRMITVDCNVIKQSLRVKRAILDYNSNDFKANPIFLELASKSLEIYNKRSDVIQQYRVKQLTNIVTQVVPDYKTKLNFEAVPIDCSLHIKNASEKALLCNVVLNCHSEILESPWRGNNKTDITVECINTKEPKYEVLAEESLHQYLQYSGITQYYQVTDVIDVTIHDQSGIITTIHFNISPVNCLFDTDRQSMSECHVTNASNKFRCKSEILEQAWLHKKEISVKCDIPHSKDVRSPRHRVDQIEQNPENPEYKIIAEKSLNQYLESIKNTQQYQLIRVTDVTTQVVAGLKTKIYFDISPTTCQVGEDQGRSFCRHYIRNCFSEIWERPWLYKKVIIVDCFAPKLSESKVDELAQASLRHYLRSSSKLFVLRRVTHFASEGVHLPTKIDFEISPTNCSVNKVSSDCKPADEIFTCHSEIKDLSSWNKNNMNVECSQNNLDSVPRNLEHRHRFSETELNVEQNYSKYLELAKLSMQHYYLMHGLSQYYDIVRVKRVTTKSKFDRNIKISFIISPTNCRLDGFANLQSSSCKIIDPNKIYDCHTEIQQRFISTIERNNIKDISINCNINEQSTRVKRELLAGGSREKLTTSNKFKALAQESLQTYLETSNSRHIFKIIEILRASTQMVSGSLTSLDFLISPTNCFLNETNKLPCTADNSTVYQCHSNVWERPWLKDDVKLISVECKNSDDLSLLNEQYDLNDVNHEIERVIRSVQSSIKSGAPQEQDSNLLKFQKLAKESLNKFMTKKMIKEPHVVVKVNRVVKKVVSGFKYDIDFTAMPKSCYQNSSCLRQETLMLKCDSEIWDRPWLKRKDMKVACRKQTVIESEVLREFVKEANNNSDPLIRIRKNIIVLPNISEKYIVGEYKEVKNKDLIKYKTLAEQALRKYERTTLFAYLYKVTEIHRVRERVADVVTNIEFSALLTDCRGNGVQTVDEHCNIQEPKIGIRCKAEISSLIPRLDKNIEVKCKNKRLKSVSLATTESNHDEVVVTRERRQLLPDDDYIEEDIKYYYAERALYDYNKRSGTNNLFKVVTIHDTDRSYHMRTLMYRIYLEIAMTYCMRHGEEHEIQYCDEIEPLTHKLCLARIYPSPDDEMIIKHVTMVCNDDTDFQTITGLSVQDLVKASIAEIEKSPDVHYRLAHQGEANLIPTLTYALPMRLSFLAVTTNCTKDIDLVKHAYRCWVDDSKPTKLCTSYIYMIPNTRNIHHLDANCRKPPARTRRAISTNPDNATTDDLLIQQMVQESIEKLEMSSLHRYKQRVLLINSFSTKITTGKVTTIDFDVGYTNCLKFEWVENITSCEFIEHLPRRHCVANFFERLWTKNSRSIDVNCEDDETPLEAHIEFESAENAMHLAREALKHIEAKYPSPQKQKVVRIFSLEKQTIAGLHYRMKIEVGFTDCVALSIEENCKLISDSSLNKFCRINVWVRPWTDHPPSYRVSCDYQEGRTTDIYHEMQAEHLFFDFLTKHKPNYANDFVELKKRYEIFRDNIKKIHELNIYERGTAKYAVTRFADLTYEEFSEKYLGLKLSLRDSNHTVPMADIPKVELPDKFDWRDFDAVTEVKDQGACGSCWAFSVTGNIEGQWKMQSGQLVSLSEQELVDCDKLDHGCSGGLPDNAYRAIEQLGGLEAENDYPYEGVNDKCSFNKTLSKVQISGAVNISSNETNMAKWLVQNGPISIGINANAMQFYVGGVSHPWKVLCNPENLDHGVLIVGYGVKDYPLFHKRLPYWIIKNSWGARWGEQGYYRVYRGDGTCGVNKMASSSVI